jgi:hypothetical protein
MLSDNIMLSDNLLSYNIVLSDNILSYFFFLKTSQTQLKQNLQHTVDQTWNPDPNSTILTLLVRTG